MSKRLSAKYHQDDKEKIQKSSWKLPKSFYINKKKEKAKQQYGLEGHKNIPEDVKQKLVEYRKNTIKWEKNALLWL